MPDSVQTILAQALEKHQAGRRLEAEKLYRQVLALEPNHADAHHFLGVLAHQAGDSRLAVAIITRAIALNPACAAYYSNLGLMFNALEQYEQAVATLQKAVQLDPMLADAHYNLGIAWSRLNRLDQAIAEYQTAVSIRPSFAKAHVDLGNALQKTGKIFPALDAYRAAIQSNPEFAVAHSNLGCLLQAIGRPEEAEHACRKAIELDPIMTAPLIGLGNALFDMGRLDESIAAYRRAIEIKPDHAAAYNNLGLTLQDDGQPDGAADAFLTAIKYDPTLAQAYNNLAGIYRDQGLSDQAIHWFRKALEIDPGNASIHSNLIYHLNFDPDSTPKTIAVEQAEWSRRHAAALVATASPHSNNIDPHRRLKIGYVSPDFWQQAECYFVVPLLEAHDHTNFEIHCYASVTRPDSVTTRLRKAADQWHDVLLLSDDKLAEKIREDGIDILIDLTMHMRQNRLLAFARKPALVQAAWLAYPGSTGLATIDHRFTDRHIDPPDVDDAWSVERAFRLNDSWCCYNPLSEIPPPTEPPAERNGYVTFGSLNNFCKINEKVLRHWTRVLHSVAGSNLLLLAHEGRNRQRIRSFFDSLGINASRISFVPSQSRQEYLKAYDRIDIGLDPFPYNGITTTCDAMWMGVPTLTLPGDAPASRAGLSLLANVGLMELAAKSEDDYVQIATDLAANRLRLARLRATLRQRMQASPLMDAPRFACGVEAAYRSMWRSYVESQKKS